MLKEDSIIHGYLDHRNRPLISVRLGNGEYITGQIDTGFNGLFLFSHSQASEYGIRVPEEYDVMLGPGDVRIGAEEVEGVAYYRFGQPCIGTAIVTAPPKPGSLARTPILAESLILIGTRFLNGCQLSIRFAGDVKSPVRIIKLRPRPPEPVRF